ncbi:MAG: ABC transporter permease [Nitrospira sp.]|nr:ABC transporter permease [Nitrospira sp.]
MRKYLIRRFFQTLLVLFGVSVVTFVILHLTGDPSALLLPQEATVEDRARFRHEMGFDDPLILQYGRFLKGALRGDFGLSFRHNQPALRLVLDRMPATIQLTVAAMLISVSVAVPIGILSAVKRNSLLDRVGMVVALLGQSMPVFWLGIMLILIFGVKLRLLPSFGKGGIDHLVLPALTLGMFTMARIARLTRSGMLGILGQEYIRTAQAKGVAPKSVVLRHALKNAAIPIITIIGLEMGTLLGGAIITETIFAWPGVGRLTIQAIYNRDFPVVQAAVFTLACIFVLINFVVDILYTYLDPRVRYE